MRSPVKDEKQKLSQPPPRFMLFVFFARAPTRDHQERSFSAEFARPLTAKEQECIWRVLDAVTTLCTSKVNPFANCDGIENFQNEEVATAMKVLFDAKRVCGIVADNCDEYLQKIEAFLVSELEYHGVSAKPKLAFYDLLRGESVGKGVKPMRHNGDGKSDPLALSGNGGNEVHVNNVNNANNDSPSGKNSARKGVRVYMDPHRPKLVRRAGEFSSGSDDSVSENVSSGSSNPKQVVNPNIGNNGAVLSSSLSRSKSLDPTNSAKILSGNIAPSTSLKVNAEINAAHLKPNIISLATAYTWGGGGPRFRNGGIDYHWDRVRKNGF